jgi:hypothetical protein
MQRLTFDGIPGLFVYPRHFAPEHCASLLRASLDVFDRLETAAAGADAGTAERARIPQPDFVRSTKHNLPSEEYYTRVALTESGGRAVNCEYFPRYGEDGHALCYFRGNANLPDFVTDGVLGPVRGLVERDGLAAPGQDLTWKLTMNFYRNVGGTVAGFPFHVDIPANGVVTMIMNIQREALFQIAKGESGGGSGDGGGDAVTDIDLPVGCLLILSGESRYRWKHRVLPMAAGGASAAPNGVERVSLVLGFQ